jgi:hypothetical protein
VSERARRSRSAANTVNANVAPGPENDLKTAMPASLTHALAVAAISTHEPGRFRGVKLGT